jgi:hypothetical protein
MECFISKPKNATFLFIAISLEYHSDRFQRLFITDFLEDKLIAVPANRVETTVYSSSRFDYGGLVYRANEISIGNRYFFSHFIV